MMYRVIGLMSGSSLDGLDIAFVQLEHKGGKWSYDILAADCMPYPAEWEQKLRQATTLATPDYLALHTAYGRYCGQLVNQFIAANGLEHQVQLIASHGHTTFHDPALGYTAQLGCGAALAATTGINVVSDLRAMDVALGGQGAPIVPMGEALLLGQYPLLLNLGGIANLSAHLTQGMVAFDVCPANRVLNMLMATTGQAYDAGGALAATGFVRDEVLAKLNQLPYYSQPWPKSLANQFGTEVVYPLLKAANLSLPDALRTMVEHIAIQITRSTGRLLPNLPGQKPYQLLATGGGAFNTFLINRLSAQLKPMGVELVVPDARTINYKEALVMALLGVLRWREENTVLHTVTGAQRSSIGGAVWVGQTA